MGNRRLLGGLLLALLLAGCAVAAPPALEPYPTSIATFPVIPTVTPGPLPDVTLPTLDGAEGSLEEWRGTPVLLNFWATWCYPCRTEMPALATVHQQGEVVVVGVNLRESAAEAQGFVSEFGIPFPILLDKAGTLSDQLGVIGLPTTFFINREGQIVGSHIGPLSAEMLDEIVAALQ